MDIKSVEDFKTYKQDLRKTALLIRYISFCNSCKKQRIQTNGDRLDFESSLRNLGWKRGVHGGYLCEECQS